jgi:hypothetical protein
MSTLNIKGRVTTVLNSIEKKKFRVEVWDANLVYESSIGSAMF